MAFASPERVDVDWVERLAAVVCAWARGADGVRALALVGSYARGEATEDSDVDFLILADDPARFRSLDWIGGVDWLSLDVRPSSWRDARHGVAWSRRLRLDDGLEVELCFAPPSWAETGHVDPGTRRVVADGWRILSDPDGRLAALDAAVRGGSDAGSRLS